MLPPASTDQRVLHKGSAQARQKRVSRSFSERRSQARISSILVRTKRARLGLSLGNIGEFLERKLVKPTKIVCSGTSNKSRFGQIPPPQAKPYIRTTGAWVLREAHAAVS